MQKHSCSLFNKLKALAWPTTKTEVNVQVGVKKFKSLSQASKHVKYVNEAQEVTKSLRYFSAKLLYLQCTVILNILQASADTSGQIKSYQMAEVCKA